MVFFVTIIFTNENTTAGTLNDSTKTKRMDMKHPMHSIEMKMSKKGHQMKDTTGIVREGIIDLKAIDANKNGKVFQDQMHWNVISDKPGKCPLCGMMLKEVTIKEVKASLKKNGFSVK
jgi:transcription initiation factor IIE alpha subunit